MSVSPRQSPEDQDHIYVAIPPPLVPPLARQWELNASSSSLESGNTHLPTPISSTNNSSISQSHAHWALLDSQYPRASYAPQGSSAHGHGIGSGSASGTGTEAGGQASGRPSNPVVSSPQLSLLPAQLLSRLYSFSSMTSPSTSSDVTSATNTNNTASSPPLQASGASRNTRNGDGRYFPTNSITNNHGSNTLYGYSRSFLQYPALGQSPELYRGGAPPSAMTESNRTAAASAIVDTLSRRGSAEGGASGAGAGSRRPSHRGESPYIPSSLSMLFSDPEVMQQQEEVTERAQMHQQQQQLRQRYMDSRRSFSFSGADNGLDAPGRAAMEGVEEDDGEEVGERHGEDRQPLLVRRSLSEYSYPHRQNHSEDVPYGYEVVIQDERGHHEGHVGEGDGDVDYHPYATMMSRNDYIAPHEPSSSSPLFPSPLTTLGRFNDPLEQTRSQAAGRIWQDYGTMDSLQHIGALHHPQQQTNMVTPTPLNQSHAAYYHAVSNYHYSSQDENGGAEGAGSGTRLGGNSNLTPCEPGRAAQWRRNRGRDISYQSYMSLGSVTGAGNSGAGQRGWFQWCGSNGNRQEDHPNEDNWLCGMLVSIVGCWVCCESPMACCSSGCCL